jgi:DNA-binding NarL/FixJ family response regulator
MVAARRGAYIPPRGGSWGEGSEVRPTARGLTVCAFSADKRTVVMYEPAPITVAVGQFEDLLARGLRSLIDEDPSLELVVENIPQARLVAVLQARRPQVAVVNFGSMESPVEVRELAGANPATHLVLLANRPSDLESAQLLAFGASACLAKSTQARDVLNAIHLAARGMQLTTRRASANGGRDAVGGALLTPRESEVLAQLQHRRSNAQIAADLHIGVETVRTHARSIYRKLGVASRRELLAPATAPAVAAARSRLRVVTLPKVS